MDYAGDVMPFLFATEDVKEGITAFLEKRKPVFNREIKGEFGKCRRNDLEIDTLNPLSFLEDEDHPCRDN